jgi:hypothetical protein
MKVQHLHASLGQYIMPFGAINSHIKSNDGKRQCTLNLIGLDWPLLVEFKKIYSHFILSHFSCLFMGLGG